MPDDRETWRRVASRAGCRRAPARRRSRACAAGDPAPNRASLLEGALHGDVWDELPPARAWGVVMRGVLGAFYSHPWALNEIGFGGPAYPRGYARLGAGQRESWEGAPASETDPVDDVKRRGLNESDPPRSAHAGARSAETTRQRLRVSAGRPSPGGPAGAHGSLRPLRTRRSGDRRLPAPAAARSPSAWRGRVAGGRARGGPILGSRPRLGVRRGRLARHLLDRGADHRRRRSGRARQEQLRPRRRRLDGPLRRILPAPSSLGLRSPHTRRSRRGLADRLRRPQTPLRAPGARAAGCRGLLAVGGPASVPAHRPPDRRRRRPGPPGRPQARYRDAGRAGGDRQRNLREPPPLHLPRFLPAGLQGQRQGLATGHPCARCDRSRRRDPRRLHGHAGRDRRGQRPSDRRAVRARRPRALPARRRGGVGRLLDRDAPAAAELHQPAVPRRAWPTATTRWAAT